MLGGHPVARQNSGSAARVRGFEKYRKLVPSTEDKAADGVRVFDARLKPCGRSGGPFMMT